jgi:hypothetical protein
VGGNNSARGSVFPPRIRARFMGGAGNFSLNRAKHALPSQLPVPAVPSGQSGAEPTAGDKRSAADKKAAGDKQTTAR